MENKALNTAKKEYAAIESSYIDALKGKGLRFAEPHGDDEECARLREELVKRGVLVRNGGASLSIGHLSPACVACTGAVGSETFSTTFKCHRDCYFCFNKNQSDYDFFFRNGCPWEERLEALAFENPDVEALGLTGGEPLLDFEGSIRFLNRARELFPKAHLRMYTSGDLLTEELAARLHNAGLDEIRFSVKDDDDYDQQMMVLNAMRLAKRYIPSVMVEMPIIPNAEEHMKDLLRSFGKIGIDGINMLEFCFPFCNWDEFAKRGFKLKNPPFEVMYDYGYSGGLAVAGSEALILRLMLWALDEGIDIGMHYCSLENKHRSEIRIKNERIKDAVPIMSFDEGDFFLKCGKVFGIDVDPVRKALDDAGCADLRYDEDEDSLAYPLKYSEMLLDIKRPDMTPIEPQVCYYVYECEDEGAYLVDIAIEDYVPV